MQLHNTPQTAENLQQPSKPEAFIVAEGEHGIALAHRVSAILDGYTRADRFVAQLQESSSTGEELARAVVEIGTAGDGQVLRGFLCEVQKQLERRL